MLQTVKIEYLKNGFDVAKFDLSRITESVFLFIVLQIERVSWPDRALLQIDLFPSENFFCRKTHIVFFSG
jgi:hypothetical protein